MITPHLRIYTTTGVITIPDEGEGKIRVRKLRSYKERLDRALAERATLVQFEVGVSGCVRLLSLSPATNQILGCEMILPPPDRPQSETQEEPDDEIRSPQARDGSDQRSSQAP